MTPKDSPFPAECLADMERAQHAAASWALEERLLGTTEEIEVMLPAPGTVEISEVRRVGAEHLGGNASSKRLVQRLIDATDGRLTFVMLGAVLDRAFGSPTKVDYTRGIHADQRGRVTPFGRGGQL